jgi:hypothetical protein
MSHMGCVCGHSIKDQTDFLPYKARMLADEDTQQPRHLLAQAIVALLDARNQGPDVERDFLIRFRATYYEWEDAESAAEWVDRYVDHSDLMGVLGELIFPVWSRYDRAIYECEACGRIYLPDPLPDPQTQRHTHYLPYLPEDGQRGVLASWYHHEELPVFPAFPAKLSDLLPE